MPMAVFAMMGATIHTVFHPVSMTVALSRSAGKRQTADTEDQQQSKSDKFLHEHLSPFRHVNGLVARGLT